MITITLPEWIVWLFCLIVAINFVSQILDIRLLLLKRKLLRMYQQSEAEKPAFLRKIMD